VDSAWLGLLPAIGLAVANTIVTQAAKFFGQKEFHNTVTSQTASQALKMTVGMIINTAFCILAISHKDWEWYKQAGLVSDVVMLIGVTGVIQPLFQFGDLKYYMSGYKRRKLNDELIDRLRDGAKFYNENALTKDNVDNFKSFKAEYTLNMKFFKKAFETSDMDMKRRYAYAVRTFVCCMYYCHLVPFICVIGIVGITVQFWVDKWMLLRWYQRPPVTQGKAQAEMSLQFLRFATLLMPVAMWFFLTPSFKSSGTVVKWMLFSYAPAVGTCILPLSAMRWIFFAPCRGRGLQKICDEPADTREDYYQAQFMWPKNQKYHKTHSLYAGLPESINPEMLSEKVSAATKAGDVQKSYGASAAAAATAASSEAEGVKLADGTTVGADSGTASEPAAAPASTPTVAGAPTAGADDGGPTLVKPVAETPPSAVAGATWELEISGGRWSKFYDDCHDYIEKKYQEYKANGGKARITVRIRGSSTGSLDFERMTIIMQSKKKAKGDGKGGKVQRVRRSEGP
jgi:hypothetical protein